MPENFLGEREGELMDCWAVDQYYAMRNGGEGGKQGV